VFLRNFAVSFQARSGHDLAYTSEL